MNKLFPTQIILEVTTACNLMCKGCAFHGPSKFVDRPMGFMDEKVWKAVISEAGSWDQEVNLATHGGGEPLLHPHLKQIIEYASSFPNIKTGFLTNGMLLNETWVDFLLSVKLDWIAFSIDGILADTHKIVRKKSDLDLIEHNLLHLLNLKSKKKSPLPRVILNMVEYDEVIDQKDDFIAKWIDKADSVLISHFRNPPISKRWPNIPEKREPCFLLWNQMVVACDGRLGLCCEDFNIDHSIGQVGQCLLLDLWNGDKMTSLRTLHETGHFSKHPMCAVCDTWADNICSETIDKEHGYKLISKASQTEYVCLSSKI